MAGHLVVVLAAVAADAGQRLSRLPVLTAGERDQLARWNDTAAPVPGGGGVHELVAAQAAARPGCGGGGLRRAWLTYGGLVERAGRLARYLRGRGSGRRRWWGCAWTGARSWSWRCWRCGRRAGRSCRWIRSYPAGRLAFMLADSGAAVVVGPGAVLDELPAGRVRVVALDDPAMAAAVAGMSPAAPAGWRWRRGSWRT